MSYTPPCPLPPTPSPLFSHSVMIGNGHNFIIRRILAIALSIESGELLEAFLWKKAEDADIESVKEELADVFAYALLLAHHYELNIDEIVLEKIKKNELKYPVEKAKGTAKKYDEL